MQRLFLVLQQVGGNALLTQDRTLDILERLDPAFDRLERLEAKVNRLLGFESKLDEVLSHQHFVHIQSYATILCRS